MPYQLPPELKTSKFESLPEDLRALAETALAEKFDLPEVVAEEKKKPAPKNKKSPTEDAWGFAEPDHTTVVDIEIRAADRFDPDRLSMSFTPVYRLRVPIMPDSTIDNAVHCCERALQSALENYRRENRGLHHDIKIFMYYDGFENTIGNRRDIGEFVERSGLCRDSYYEQGRTRRF